MFAMEIIRKGWASSYSWRVFFSRERVCHFWLQTVETTIQKPQEMENTGNQIYYFFLGGGGFFKFLFFRTLFSTASSAAPQIPLCRRMLGSNPGPLQLVHWQPDALTTRLDLIRGRLDLIRLLYIPILLQYRIKIDFPKHILLTVYDTLIFFLTVLNT